MRTAYLTALHLGLGKIQRRHVKVKDLTDKKGRKSRRYTSKHSRYPVIILHGLTALGYEDYRLTPFASNLALCGFEVYTPHIEGLAELDLRFDDVERLVDDIRSIKKDHKKVGIMGFSVGGTYGLITAAQKNVRKNIGFVLAASPYYSYGRLIKGVLSDPESDIYARLVMVHGALDYLDMSKRDKKEFKEIMSEYCLREDSFTKHDKEFLEKIGKQASKGEVVECWNKKSDQNEKLDLSLNPYLNKIKAPVFLMHAAEDKLVPAEETLKIQQELKKRGKDVGMQLTDTAGHTSYLGTSALGVLKLFNGIMKLTG